MSAGRVGPPLRSKSSQLQWHYTRVFLLIGLFGHRSADADGFQTTLRLTTLPGQTAETTNPPFFEPPCGHCGFCVPKISCGAFRCIRRFFNTTILTLRPAGACDKTTKNGFIIDRNTPTPGGGKQRHELTDGPCGCEFLHQVAVNNCAIRRNH